MINALRYTEELEKAGFTSEQAKTSVDTWMSLMDQNFATRGDFREYQLANSSDLKDLRLELKGEIQEVRAELKTEIQEVRAELKTEIQDLRIEMQDLRIEMQSLKSELRSEIHRSMIQMGALIVTTSTVGFSILAFLISR